MKLNHLNLAVADAAETARFLEKYFGLCALGGTEHKKTFAILTDDDGLVLTLIRAGGGEISYPPTFHLGFGQESEEKVNEIHRRLQDDGYCVEPPSRQHAWTFTVRAPGGFDIEVASP